MNLKQMRRRLVKDICAARATRDRTRNLERRAYARGKMDGLQKALALVERRLAKVNQLERSP